MDIEYDFAQMLDDDLASPCPGGCGKSSLLCECRVCTLPGHVHLLLPGQLETCYDPF